MLLKEHLGLMQDIELKAFHTNNSVDQFSLLLCKEAINKMGRSETRAFFWGEKKEDGREEIIKCF